MELTNESDRWQRGRAERSWPGDRWVIACTRKGQDGGTRVMDGIWGNFMENQQDSKDDQYAAGR